MTTCDTLASSASRIVCIRSCESGRTGLCPTIAPWMDSATRASTKTGIALLPTLSSTTGPAGSCTAAAEAMAARLRAGGLPAQDVQVIVPPGGPKKGNLVARYRGTGAKKPIMLLGHLDVVEAKREDWQRDPFRLVEENGYFYARGAADDKAMVAVFVANLVRYRKEGYRPERDLVLVATCDEEIVPSNFSGIVHLLKNHRNLIDAEFALNEGGNGLLDKNG